MNMKDVKSIGERLTAGKGKAQGETDAAVIRELADLLSETGLSEIEIERDGARVRVVRQFAAAPVFAAASPPAAGAPAVPAAAPPPAGPPAGAVPSPMVGTIYIAPEPGKPAFIKVGDTVKEGDTLLIVEAMKTMNPILAPRGGTIREICVHDSDPVEFGQTLVVIS
jgi:acetyl-CoA carboxylase biotin carboxyl carrier protein